MLSVTSLTKRYDAITALDSVSLTIESGEFFGLLGPNGAGKSTLMSLIAGLRRPDSGAIALGGRTLDRRDAGARRALGIVPQTIALYDELTAEENLKIFGELQGLRGRELNDRIGELLAAVRLEDRRQTPVKTFSGGMQRRLNLIAALLHRPKLLLCDEPTVGVDPQSRNAIFDYLEQLNAEGLTIIYSTHYMEEAERLCSRIGIIDHGRILALGTLADLLTQLPFEEEIEFPDARETRALANALSDNGSVRTVGDAVRFLPRSGFPLSTFFARAEALSLSSRLFTIRRPTLEALFLHLTGRTLRDA